MRTRLSLHMGRIEVAPNLKAYVHEKRLSAVRLLLEGGVFSTIAQVLADNPSRAVRDRYWIWRRRNPVYQDVVVFHANPPRGVGDVRRYYCRASFRMKRLLVVPYVATIVCGERGRKAPPFFLVFRSREEAASFLGSIPVRWWEPSEFLEFLQDRPFQILMSEAVLVQEIVKRNRPPNPWQSRAYAITRLSALPGKMAKIAIEWHEEWLKLREDFRRDFPYRPPDYILFTDLADADAEWPLGFSGNWFDVYRAGRSGGTWRLWLNLEAYFPKGIDFVFVPLYVHPLPSPRDSQAPWVSVRRLVRWFLFETLVWVWTDPRPFLVLGAAYHPVARRTFLHFARSVRRFPLSLSRRARSHLAQSFTQVAINSAVRLAAIWAKTPYSHPRRMDLIPSAHQEEWLQEAGWALERLDALRPGDPMKALEGLAKEIGPAAEWRWNIRKQAIRKVSGFPVPPNWRRIPVPDFSGYLEIIGEK